VSARNTTRTRRTPAQSRSQATVDAILEATAWVLADRGFARATTNRIAEVAGVNIATLYRYFPNKDALLGALIDREAKATLEHVARALKACEDAPLEEAVRLLLHATIEGHRLDPRVHRELVEQIGRSGRIPALRAIEEDIAARLLAYLRRRTAREGWNDATVSAFLALHAGEALVHAILFSRPPSVTREEAVEGAVRMLVGALGTRP
jgi:AcrR family transcriptional regulator